MYSDFTILKNHIDGGANIFALTDKTVFYVLQVKYIGFTQASGSEAPARGTGIALMRFPGTSKIYPVPAFWVPDNPVSTFSPGALKHYLGFKSAAHEPLSHCQFIDSQEKNYVIRTVVDNNLDYMNLEFLNPNQPRLSSLVDPVIAGLATKYPSSQLIHQRFGHISNDRIQQMCKEQSLSDLPKSFKPLRTPCPICIVTKGKRIPRNPTVDVPLEPGTRLHMDFTFFNVPSIRKFTSVFTIIDASSAYPWGFPSRSKRPPISTFQWFISVLRSMGKTPLYIRVDEGGELAKSAEFCRTVVGLNLILETTGGYASNLNGKIETMHGTSKDMTRALLQARSHSDDKWCFAFTYAIFIIRRTINSRIKMTPYEKWHSIKPSFKDLTVFGCHVYVLNATKSRKALDSRTQTDLRDIITNQDIDGYFMGYSNTTKVVVYWDPTNNTIKRTHHCFLDEFDTRVSSKQKHTPGALLLAECATGHHNYVPPPPEDIHLTVSQFDIAKSAFPAEECHTYQVDIPPQGQRFYIQVGDDSDFHIPYLDKLFRESPWLRTLPPFARRNMWIVSINAEEPIMGTTFIDIIKSLQHATETTTAELILAKRDPTAVTSYQGHRAIFDQMRPIISHMASLPIKPTVQSNIGTALKSPDRYHWKEACFSQYDKNAEANAFSKPIPVSALPKDTPVYRSVIQPGVKPTGVPDLWQFIARHCANGAGMEKGFDYVESYAPITTACSIRIIIALAAGHGMTLALADVKNAFQNTMLPVGERVHLTLPPYYHAWFRRKYPNVRIEPLADEKDKYCVQSINAIQGTKPAGHQWNTVLTKVLLHHDYKQNHVDHAVFTWHSEDRSQSQIICVSTDDFLCAFTHRSLFDQLCTTLRKYFELTTKEGPKLSYLNLEINQTEHYISIDQTAHIREIVQEWFPDEAELRTTDTPFRTDNEYEQIISEALPAESAELIDLERLYGGPYRTSLGKFQHVKEWTRPDLSYATSRLSSFNVAPTEPAFQGLKRIARYRLASHPDKLAI